MKYRARPPASIPNSPHTPTVGCSPRKPPVARPSQPWLPAGMQPDGSHRRVEAHVAFATAHIPTGQASPKKNPYRSGLRTPRPHVSYWNPRGGGPLTVGRNRHPSPGSGADTCLQAQTRIKGRLVSILSLPHHCIHCGRWTSALM